MTPKQKRVLDFIKSYWDANGYAPSYREIMDGVGMKSMAHISGMIRQLSERGFIVKMPGRARSIRVTE